MKRLAIVLTVLPALLLAPSGATAQELAGQPIHVVEAGETLGLIAQQYYDDASRWRAIFEANRDVISDPDALEVGTRLVIPRVDEAVTSPAGPTAEGAEIELPVEGRTVAGRPVSRTQFYEPPPAGSIVDPPPGRTRFYLQNPAAAEAASPTVLSEDVALHVPIKAAEFFASPWLQDPEALAVVGELVKVLQSPQTFGRETEVGHMHDDVFLTFEGARPDVGERLMLVTTGRDIDGFGTVILPTAILRVTALEPQLIVARVSEQYDRVAPGQIAIPMPRYPDFAGGAAEPVEDGAVGEVVGFEQEQPIYGLSDHGFVSLASPQVGVGDELIAYLEERAIEGREEILPPEPIADMVVVRLGEQTATVRVSNVRHAVLDVGSRVRVARRVR